VIQEHCQFKIGPGAVSWTASMRRLGYVVLRCADIERSRVFYEALGFQLVAEQHGTGAKHYACDVGGVTLELYPSAGKSTSGLRLGLVVSDLAAGQAVTVTDPDGHQIAFELERAG
jgi:lactoylglutathione lyase